MVFDFNSEYMAQSSNRLQFLHVLVGIRTGTPPGTPVVPTEDRHESKGSQETNAA